MTRPDLSDEAAIAKYRAELRAVARAPRLAGFAFVILGAIAVWGSNVLGAAGQVVLWIGYAALAVGWALMLAAIFMRTRYHRRRMAELD
ncbi:hypothetical protein [Brevundimonas sp. Root1279]|uniref:hypothetical protein n=1 Tax=Brevundimonas sp. Root1279 TaxID=1736443 RepID=UPI0006F37D6F|nr:hypothetical protein [Brevundimonas sp. Root1279]KQW83648.1 hypothetical protein ASC65_03055 [Brevundimonas sp. Root1279]